MEHRLELDMTRQPDDFTCGPTCLHALYRYYGREIDLEKLIGEIPTLETGGTLGVHLARHALRSGFRATIYTYNLNVFDPSWFELKPAEFLERLQAQHEAKTDPKLREASAAYRDFMENGGRVRFQDLTGALIRRYLDRSIPILTGLSATYLYQTPRELGDDFDDVRGEPVGHFVILSGYDRASRRILVSDPLHSNPYSESLQYTVEIDRLIGAILLGIVTYDANLVVIEAEDAR